MHSLTSLTILMHTHFCCSLSNTQAVAKTLKAMERVDDIRTRRQERFYEARMQVCYVCVYRMVSLIIDACTDKKGDRHKHTCIHTHTHATHTNTYANTCSIHLQRTKGEKAMADKVQLENKHTCSRKHMQHTNTYANCKHILF